MYLNRESIWILAVIAAGFLEVVLIVNYSGVKKIKFISNLVSTEIKEEQVVEEVEEISGFFMDSFEEDKIIFEAGKKELSGNKAWWVSSGGQLLMKDGIGSTLIGKLEKEDFWRELYKKNNSRDTDDGYHPQNIFRLVNRGVWKNFQQEVYFKIVADNLSKSSYRNDSNGLLLFNRYKDSQNVYYTGIRVDGFAVIKKKINGKYFTMAYERVFDGKYDRKKEPNLLPHKKWIGLRSEVEDNEDGSVSVKLFIDKERNGDWQLIAEAKDDGKKYGGDVISGASHAGIRTDFMDVQFDDYRIEENNLD